MDIELLIGLQNIRNTADPVFSELLRNMSLITDAEFLVLLIGIIYWCFSKKTGVYLMTSFAFSRILNGFLKVTFCQYRPWIKDSRIIPEEKDFRNATGYSFPSGHASNGTIFYGGLTFRKNVPIILKLLAVVLIATVCLSRMYLGAHTPQDVCIGVLVGIVSLIACRFILKYIENNPNKDVIVCLIAVIICAALALYAGFKDYPINYDNDQNILVQPISMIKDCFRNVGFGLGFTIGWILERRFVKFDTKCKVSNKIVRFLVCMCLYYLLTFLEENLITTQIFGIYVYGFKNFITTFYIMFIAPLLIVLIDFIFNKNSVKNCKKQ